MRTYLINYINSEGFFESQGREARVIAAHSPEKAISEAYNLYLWEFRKGKSEGLLDDMFEEEMPFASFAEIMRRGFNGDSDFVHVNFVSHHIQFEAASCGAWNELSFDVNNGIVLLLRQEEADGDTYLLKKDGDTVETDIVIPPGDMVMLLNYYRYIKENNIFCDFLNPYGTKASAEQSVSSMGSELIKKLHAAGGCGASDEYAKGWDAAITEAMLFVENAFSHNGYTLKIDDVIEDSGTVAMLLKENYPEIITTSEAFGCRRTFNIGFINPHIENFQGEGIANDETQLDAETLADLEEVYEGFCRENNLPADTVTYVEPTDLQYRYGMRSRGFSPGCQPKEGLVEAMDGYGEYYDILVYDRELTEEELRDYQLDPLGIMPDEDLI